MAMSSAQETKSAAERRRPIALAPMGMVEPRLLDWLAHDVQRALGGEVVLAPRLVLPDHAFSERRGQWHSTELLDVLAELKEPEWLRVLGVVDVDLYVPQLNFVFGEADQRRGVAVFSTWRLHAPSGQTDRFHRRVTTEVVHELGHTFGLAHCSRPSCVMWFSNTLAETDAKGPRPCEVHARQLERALEAGG